MTNKPLTKQSLLTLLNEGEGQKLELKSAQMGLPKSLWESMSAFANTNGGIVVLGVEERGRGVSIEGLVNPSSLLRDFWNGHNNPQKIKPTVCSEQDVQVLSLEGKNIIIIRVPKAERQQRPVFIKGNPFVGTYKRSYEGDYVCTENEVRQMLRESSEEAQDSLI